MLAMNEASPGSTAELPPVLTGAAQADPKENWKDLLFRRRGWFVAASVSLLALAVFAVGGWPKPTPLHAWCAAPLVLLGMGMRVWARCYLVRGTNTRRVHARRLVEGGPYRRIRNPIYVGNVAAASGLALAFAGPLPAALLFALLGAIYSAVVRSEEAVLTRTFPERFRRLSAVPRWWPRARLRAPALADDADAPAPQLLAALRGEVQRILGAGAAWWIAVWLASQAT